MPEVLGSSFSSYGYRVEVKVEGPGRGLSLASPRSVGPSNSP